MLTPASDRDDCNDHTLPRLLFQHLSSICAPLPLFPLQVDCGDAAELAALRVLCAPGGLLTKVKRPSCFISLRLEWTGEGGFLPAAAATPMAEALRPLAYACVENGIAMRLQRVEVNGDVLRVVPPVAKLTLE